MLKELVADSWNPDSVADLGLTSSHGIPRLSVHTLRHNELIMLINFHDVSCGLTSAGRRLQRRANARAQAAHSYGHLRAQRIRTWHHLRPRRLGEIA